MKNKSLQNIEQESIKKGFNPIWFLVGMGILISLILIVELLELKK